MHRWALIPWLLAALLALAAPAQADWTDGIETLAFTKLCRGAANVLTGWLELLKQPSLTEGYRLILHPESLLTDLPTDSGLSVPPDD